MPANRCRFLTRRPMHLQPLEARVVPAVFVVLNPDNAGAGSLRQAVLDANAAPGPDSITFDPVAFATPQTIVLTTGELKISEAVTVTGPGAALASVSGSKATRVLTVAPTNPGESVTISGLTVREGKSNVGGGVFATAAAVTLTDCVITGNRAIQGGGILVDGSNSPASLALQNCTVSNNVAIGTSPGSPARGGGVFAEYATLSFLGCTISGNTAFWDGGGVYSSYSDVTLGSCTVSGNSVGKYGGGMFCYGDANNKLTLTNCSVSGNSSGFDGGGISCYYVAARLENCTVTNNTAGDGGGGLYGYNNLSTLINCTISGNSADRGGGVYCYDNASATLTNCTVTGNKAASVGGGVYCYYNASATLTNCTVTGNSADSSGGGIYNYYYSTVTLLNTIVAGNFAGTAAPDDISGDPMDAASANNLIGDAATAGGLTHGVNGNVVGVAGSGTIPIATVLNTTLASNGGLTKTHALAAGSPAIDAGSDAVLGPPLNLSTDQRGPGFARKSGAHVDIGAFEFLPPPPTVSKFEVSGGAVQRSIVTSFKVTFSDAVSFPVGVAAAFRLERLGPGPPDGSVNLAAVPAGTSVNVTFAAGGAVAIDPGGSLADGAYQLTIVAANVLGPGGPLDGDGDGVPGGDYVSPAAGAGRIHRLFGDADGDGDVDTADFRALRLAFAAGVIALFDYDNDGTLDFGQFRSRFGEVV